MKIRIFCLFLLVFPLKSHSQIGGMLINELPVYPPFNYGSVTTKIVNESDSVIKLEVADYETGEIYATGTLSSINPVIKEGRFTFFTPNGKPYAVGYYHNNIPSRRWSFFDENGNVTRLIDYDRVMSFINDRTGIDIGNDYVTLADMPPQWEKGNLLEYIYSLEEEVIYPPLPALLGEEDRVICQFTIDKNGEMINPSIIRGTNTDLNMEVMRVLALPSQWTPATIDCVAVNYETMLPINFKFSKENRPRVLTPILLNRYPSSYEKIEGSKIKIYFDENGNLSNSDEYAFHRVGNINPETNIIEGTITDFNNKERKVFKAEVHNGTLNGEAIIYDKKENVEVTGHFTNGKRDKTWSYYYPNGKLKAKLDVRDNKVYVTEFYKKNGEATVIDGSGEMKWGEEGKYKGIKGRIEDGLRVGSWKNSDIVEDYDEKGNFLQNLDKNNGFIYSKQPFQYMQPIINEDPSTVYLKLNADRDQ